MMNTEMIREEVITEEVKVEVTTEKKEIPFVQKLGWFLLGLILVIVGTIVGYIFAPDFINPNIPTKGEVIGYTGVIMMMYSQFAKQSIYQAYKNIFRK